MSPRTPRSGTSNFKKDPRDTTFQRLQMKFGRPGSALFRHGLLSGVVDRASGRGEMVGKGLDFVWDVILVGGVFWWGVIWITDLPAGCSLQSIINNRGYFFGLNHCLFWSWFVWIGREFVCELMEVGFVCWEFLCILRRGPYKMGLDEFILARGGTRSTEKNRLEDHPN